MDRDKQDLFRFAALQSDAGIKLQKEYGIDPGDLQSFILIENGKFYKKTTAALKVGKDLGFPYILLYPFIILPPPIRNIAYNILAKYRYKWFGKRDACRIPSPAERAKFL
jgi:predicted DCC family thiol-disulfide oxidoreductase YuxK